MMVKRVPLDNVCEKKVATLSTQHDGLIDYVDISSVDNESKRIVGFQTLSAKDAPSRAKQLLEVGDILVSTVRPNLNAVAIVEKMTDNLLVGSTGYCVLRCRKQVDRRYVYHFCQSPYFVEDMTTQATGASYPAVTAGIVKNSCIPFRSIEEQREIANKLDSVSKLISMRKEQIAKLDELVKARFVEMFGDPVHNSQHLPTKTLAELGSLDRGRSKHRPRNDPALLGGPYPLIQTGEVTNAGLFITSYHNTYSELGLQQSKMWKAGTLCITIAANIAQTAILTFDACFPDSVVGFVPSGEVHPIYMHYWFGFFQKILDEQAPQVAQKNINLKILSELEVMVPCLEMQERFVSFVEQTNKSKLTIQASLDKLEVMKKALMQEYFG